MEVMKVRTGGGRILGAMSRNNGLLILVTLLLIIALAGGDPKPQQNVRVIPVPHPTNTNYRNRIKDYPHHMRRDHQQFRNNKENKRAQKKKGNDKEDKFKLWKEGPNFDTDLRQNVYAQEGQTAVLTCRVYDRGNKTVSWIRHEDLHILTVGRYTYTADMRFHSKYNSKKDEWRLEIGSVQKHDSGRYECQVNTQPVRSFFVQLKVVDALPLGKGSGMVINDDPLKSSPSKHSRKDSGNKKVLATKATILGDKDVYIDIGSSLKLTCNVRQVDSRALYPNDPHFIIWKRNNETIDYDKNAGSKDNRFTVKTTTNDLEQCTSQLIIHSVVPSDHGEYTCHPSAPSRDASVRVHIGKLTDTKQLQIRTNSATRAYFGSLAFHLTKSVTSHTDLASAIYDFMVIAQLGILYLIQLLVVIMPTILYTTQFSSISLLQRL